MRMRALVAVGLTAGTIAIGAGCTGEPMAPSTAPVSDGSQVSAQRYLADSAAFAAVVRDFAGRLEHLGPVARPAGLREAAPDLAAALQRADALAERLAGERLQDARLEAQRARVAPRAAAVVAAMVEVTTHAAAGEAPQTVAALDRFRAAVTALGTFADSAP